MAIHMYLGSDCEAKDLDDLELPHTVRKCRGIIELLHLLEVAAPGDDTVEFCGGAARATIILCRRMLTTGGNWDLCTGFDLNNYAVQNTAKQYLRTRGAAVTIAERYTDS